MMVGKQSYVKIRLFFYRSPFIAEAIAASTLLALATVAFFWQILLTPNHWMPAGGGDLAPFLYPNYRFAAEHLRQGIIPLWNPYLYSGTPFAADIQSGLFYPINLLVFLLVPKLTYFWLAGVTMYICLRLLVLPNVYPTMGQPSAKQTMGQPIVHQTMGQPIAPLAAFAGAIAFEFSDLFIVHFGNLNMIAVAAWLPLVFLLFHHSLIRTSLGLAAAAGVVLAIATLAGHIQITLFILLTLGTYTLWYIAVSYKKQSPTNPPRIKQYARYYKALLALFITLLVTIGLSALLLMPAYEMSQHTPRAELTYQEAARYSLHPAQTVGLLIPNYFGRDPALHWGPWERVETGYIGLMTLMLALIGALLYKGWLKGYFLALGLLSLLLAMGGYTLLHGWLYATTPGFDQLRAPARFIVLLDFALAMLAACGLNQLLQTLEETTRATLANLLKVLSWGLGGLIVVALPLSYYAMLVTQDRNPAIFNRAVGAASGVVTFAIFATAALIILQLIKNQHLQGVWAGLAVITIIGLDLFTLGYNVDVGQNNPVTGFEHPEALAFLQSDPNLYRLEVTTDVWHAWQPDTALLHNLRDAWGLYNPLTLADSTLYWSSAFPRSSGRYNFLGIKYIIASKAGAPADGNIIPVFDSDPQINIYLNQNTMAPVQFVGQAIVVPNHEAAWEALHVPDFDPATAVILEGGQTLDSQPNSQLEIWGYDLHTVTIYVITDQPGYLVLPDAYYPGWQATIDGDPTPIQRANYAFRAVYVPAGEHTVQFVFKPTIWKIGLIISGGTLLLLIIWGIWHWQKNRSKNK